MTAPTATPTIAEASLKGLCPRCGASTLFEGPVKFAPRCRGCGLDFSTFNVGDGPAAFITLGIGAVVVILALATDFTIRPPLWVHMLLWIPLTLAGVVGALRVAKGALIASEYRNAAREGRIEDAS
ncbi:DUF983 domain-containing protein [Sphingomonas sp.]|uniref:DUF983 domain-containing protein n=1 Tax=Sphingomonas sp. TaxID=28214 RepID=UPI002C33EAD9|nr:DUF983 domain-containing protein [Sphingomonas sp.]HWK36903.1 DUF983 domain-containing protein [Sphingomonas sp.]